MSACWSQASRSVAPQAARLSAAADRQPAVAAATHASAAQERHAAGAVAPAAVSAARAATQPPASERAAAAAAAKAKVAAAQQAAAVRTTQQQLATVQAAADPRSSAAGSASAKVRPLARLWCLCSSSAPCTESMSRTRPRVLIDARQLPSACLFANGCARDYDVTELQELHCSGLVLRGASNSSKVCNLIDRLCVAPVRARRGRGAHHLARVPGNQPPPQC